jgi:hypothetical protein
MPDLHHPHFQSVVVNRADDAEEVCVVRPNRSPKTPHADQQKRPAVSGEHQESAFRWRRRSECRSPHSTNTWPGWPKRSDFLRLLVASSRPKARPLSEDRRVRTGDSARPSYEEEAGRGSLPHPKRRCLVERLLRTRECERNRAALLRSSAGGEPLPADHSVPVIGQCLSHHLLDLGHGPLVELVTINLS